MVFDEFSVKNEILFRVIFFNSKLNLLGNSAKKYQDHMTSMSETESYMCPHCSMTFLNRAEMRKHVFETRMESQFQHHLDDLASPRRITTEVTEDDESVNIGVLMRWRGSDIFFSRDMKKEEVHPDTPNSHPSGDDEEADGLDMLDRCVVCMINKSHIAGKCGHLCCCIGCSRTIHRGKALCPKCRKPWTDLRRVYRG